MSKRKAEDFEDDDDDEDDDQVWEEVADSMETDAVDTQSQEASGIGPSFTIQIPTAGERKEESRKKVKKARGIRKKDRLLRIEIHKLHLACLLTSAIGIAMSMVPKDLLGKVVSSNGSTKTKKSKGRKLFLNYLRMLVKWWKEQFPTQVENSNVPDFKLSQESFKATLGAFLEKLPSDPTRAIPPNTSAVLFTAACRGVGLDARLICSLHPMPLSLATTALAPEAGTEMTDETLAFNMWTEVYSEEDKDWIALNPITGDEGHGKLEPSASLPLQLQLSYVVACESGFGVKDVTKRYTSQWSGRTIKLRLESCEEEQWWETCLWLVSKSNRTEKDSREDDALETSQTMESMPTNLAGFKNHALFALEKQCSQTQMIHPSGKEYAVGNFKGDLVYPRSLVRELFSMEAWKRKGRKIKDNESPVKIVKARASTVSKKREIEAARQNTASGLMDEGLGTNAASTSLYGEWQTDVYEPPPIIDGKLPKNSYGNIELFHPNMLPKGAVHVDVDGAAIVAKKLGLEYARAVTGFDFHAGKSTPTIKGVLVLAENEELLREALREHHQFSEEKAVKQKSTRVLSLWRRLTSHLLTKQALMEKYMK
ncbi:hypothetical protein HDU76_006053 [Blyttiomyces sp. JEL0837]|nr:hypothetical protein HDU76_006053 [Blyttiomyces sp. JEL0837]